jgi:uncharacterized protein (TIGR02757 family)
MITKREIESIYRKHHNRRYLDKDPLGCVRKFDDSESREVVGLFSAALAYGRVETIVSNVKLLIDGVMGGEPAAFVKGTSYTEKRRALVGFKHRFDDGENVAALLEAAKRVIRRHGSLGGCFSDCLTKGGGQFKAALALFTDELKGVLIQDAATRDAMRPSFERLVPSPTRKSACKRMVLYLRWMVRKDDGIDLGVWKGVPTSILLIPVDANVKNIAIRYGLTTRSAADWKMAEEITSALRKFDPEDPVRFDFSLCHSEMENARG